MIGLWILVVVLSLVAVGCREVRWFVVPFVVLLVAFGLMCERGEQQRKEESK